jgi:hypothetical protein
MSEGRAFVVVPFQRVGSSISPQQMLVLNNVDSAKALANALSRTFPGVALIEKRIDEDTGADIEIILAQTGAVPAGVGCSTNWTMPLH